MATLKKSLTRVKSTLNRTTSKISLLNTNNNTDSSSTPFSISNDPADQSDLTVYQTLSRHETDSFGLKYEDIHKVELSNRKRNFSQTNSISSSSQRRTSEASDSLSRSNSSASSALSHLLHHESTADNTLIAQSSDHPSANNEEFPLDPLEVGSTTFISQIETDNLLPPIPTEGMPPCNDEELSPIIPSSISPIAEEPLNAQDDRRSSNSSVCSSAGLQQAAQQTLPLVNNRPRALSNLRTSVTSQSSIPTLSASITAILESEEHDSNFSTLDTQPGLSIGSAQQDSGLVATTEDDIADAMAISILEKVPHHKELSVEDWCI